MIANLSLLNPPPSSLFPIRPVPLPAQFRSHLPVVVGDRNRAIFTEAIHVSDLTANFAKNHTNNNKSTTFPTTLLTLFSWLANLIIPKPKNTDFKNSSLPSNDRNSLNATNIKPDLGTGFKSIKKQKQQRNRYGCRYGFQGRYCDPCGLTFAPPPLVNKIVGGFEATPHSWPASAYIVFTYKADVFLQDQGVFYKLEEQMVCGGSLISRDTVLSAAHCIVKKIDFNYNGKDYSAPVNENNYFPTIASMYTVYLGMHEITSALTGGSLGQGTVKSSVRAVITYPYFNDDNLQNDISLIKLSQEVALSQFVQLACLPDSRKPDYPSSQMPAADVYAMGWGTTQQGGSVSTVLRNVKLTLYDGRRCESVLPHAIKNWQSQLCAGELSGGRDTCQGDSGGSVYVRDLVDGQMKFVAVGIVSYGDGCAKPLTPGLYTKISAFLPWIDFNY